MQNCVADSNSLDQPHTRRGCPAVRSELVQLAAEGVVRIGMHDPIFPRLSAWLGAPVWFNGWRESVTVQVSRPIAGVAVAHLVAQSRESLTVSLRTSATWSEEAATMTGSVRAIAATSRSVSRRPRARCGPQTSGLPGYATAEDWWGSHSAGKQPPMSPIEVGKCVSDWARACQPPGSPR